LVAVGKPRGRSNYLTVTGKRVGQDGCGYPDALIACPDFVLSTLSLTVSELIEEALARFDLRLRDYRLLRLLLLDGPQLQGAVGPALRVDRTTVVALVDKVELKKLVRRSRSDTDRRAYLLSLTAKGERVARAATTTVNAVEEDFFAPLDAKERSDLRSLSMRLLAEPGAIANAHAATRRR
jgi:DNA-binding MarR family transcriptional regulator